jgi:DNA-binding transcriptional regulator YiaG
MDEKQYDRNDAPWKKGILTAALRAELIRRHKEEPKISSAEFAIEYGVTASTIRNNWTE